MSKQSDRVKHASENVRAEPVQNKGIELGQHDMSSLRMLTLSLLSVYPYPHTKGCIMQSNSCARLMPPIVGTNISLFAVDSEGLGKHKGQADHLIQEERKGRTENKQLIKKCTP